MEEKNRSDKMSDQETEEAVEGGLNDDLYEDLEGSRWPNFFAKVKRVLEDNPNFLEKTENGYQVADNAVSFKVFPPHRIVIGVEIDEHNRYGFQMGVGCFSRGDISLENWGLKCRDIENLSEAKKRLSKALNDIDKYYRNNLKN